MAFANLIGTANITLVAFIMLVAIIIWVLFKKPKQKKEK
ncbi:hypothetical protein B0H94_11167 [Salsuginibacillus halophilus]|uniref:Uncharacterized protein n=1 Tax=Salsuginibacillus halophilus TaxID=517424 RepID=A0A2P8HAI9_9BACI|nr:hypothetical protein B0H94_11167 [Salsuginibacillus halophilus]